MNGKITQQLQTNVLDLLKLHNDQPVNDHAIVIGSSMAGLTAAQVLLHHVDHVTIVERDTLHDALEFRQGVPQARHPHTLLKRGQNILEHWFPGLTAELLAQGAILIDVERDLAFYVGEEQRTPKQHEDTLSIASSRPLLETMLHRRLAANPRVTILSSHEVTSLRVDAGRRRVTGVNLRQRHKSGGAELQLTAGVVVDASGRNSHAPQWLQALGYTPPPESTIDVSMGYATRIYRRPETHHDAWRAMYVRPVPPAHSRGGMIIPLEGDRWHVALIGIGGDYPPTDEDGFLHFARSLPTDQFYAAIRDAEPLSKTVGYRLAASRLRHYEQLPRYLEGFLVYGDAVISTNPVHTQGMTAVALGSLALAKALEQHRPSLAAGDVSGLAQTFQARLAQAVERPWQKVLHEDQQWLVHLRTKT